MAEQKFVTFVIERQDGPDSKPYTQEFDVPYRPSLNVVAALMEIQKNPVTRDGKNEVCHIYIKGCATEDYSSEEDYFFGRSGILETESEEASVKAFSEDGEMCDSEGCRKLHPHLCRCTAAG